MKTFKKVYKRSIAYKLIAKGFEPDIKINHKSEYEKFVFVFEESTAFLIEFDKLMSEHQEIRKKELLYY